MTKRLLLYAATLGLGFGGGWAFSWLGIPLPWLLGPLLTIGALGLFGVDLATPKASRQLGQLLLGTGIGLYFTPAVAAFVVEHLGVIVSCGLASISFGAIAGLILQRTASVDIATAYFSCVPGGVAEMAVQAERYGGETGPVALAQSLRILFVVVTIPPAIIFWGATGTDPFGIPKVPFDPAGFGGLLLISLAAGWLLAWRKVTNAWLLGPLAAGAVVTVTQSDLSGMPTEILNISQVLIGSTLGLRYRRDAIVRLRKFLLPAMLSTFALIGLNVVFGMLAAQWSGLPVSTMVLSVSPGGMAEMSITAKVLALGVPLIAAFHIVRIFLVIGLSGLLFRYVLGRRPPSS